MEYSDFKSEKSKGAVSLKSGENWLSRLLDQKSGTSIKALQGLGRNQPSVGFGFRMMERHGGLSDTTSSQWLQGAPNTPEECLKLPSGKTFRVLRILGDNNNEYVVLEVSNWLSRLLDRKSGTSIKALQGLGFSEKTQKVVSESSKG